MKRTTTCGSWRSFSQCSRSAFYCATQPLCPRRSAARLPIEPEGYSMIGLKAFRRPVVGRCLPLDFAQLEEIQALLPKFLALPKGKILTARTRTHALIQYPAAARARSHSHSALARARKGARRVRRTTEPRRCAREPELPRACVRAQWRECVRGCGRAAVPRTAASTHATVAGRSARPHLRRELQRDWAHPCPHLRRDWVRSCPPGLATGRLR